MKRNTGYLLRRLQRFSDTEGIQERLQRKSLLRGAESRPLLTSRF